MNAESTLNLVASLENLDQVRSFIKNFGERFDIESGALSELVLVLDEAITNIVNHGYQGGSGPVSIAVRLVGEDLKITIRDEAPVFNRDTVQAPKLDTPFSERAFGGMGVFLMEQFTDELDIRPVGERGNELRLLKRNVIAKKSNTGT